MRPAVKTLSLLLLSSSLLASCVGLKEGRLGAEEGVEGRVVERIVGVEGGAVEVRCGTGEVCAEVKVVHVQRSDDGGPIEVTLMNRTQADVAVQLAIESFDDRGRRSDRSGFHDVILAPRGEQVLALVSEADVDDTLVLHLRARSS
jgi:hypothetical protein